MTELSDRQSHRRISGALANGAAMSLGLSSPKGNGNANLNLDAMPAFTIAAMKGIPDKATIRTENTSRNRLDSLMRRADHKSGTTKFDKSTHSRSINPLTSEDINQFQNLHMMSTLRSMQPAQPASKDRPPMIENPPSFYEDDLRKKQEKYSKAIKDRTAFKRTYWSKERRTILAGNDNFEDTDPDKRLAETRYTGGQIQATRSEFKRVVQRRRSRQSVAAPTNTDIDFIGNSNDHHHLIKAGKLTKDELTFGMNLRSYKNTTEFSGQQPWSTTGTKVFEPKKQYEQTNSFLQATNKPFSAKFKDKHAERNAGEIMHMARRNDVYENIGWMTSLRGDRDERNAVTNSNQKKRLKKQQN